MDTGKVTALILKDLSAAFGTIHYYVLLYGLSDWHGRLGTAFARISSLLINRFQLIKILNFQRQFLGLAAFYKVLFLNCHLYADDTEVYISLSTADIDLSFIDLGGCLSDLTRW